MTDRPTQPPPASPEAPPRNPQTIFASLPDGPRIDAEELASGYAWARQGATMRPPAVETGYRLFWALPPEMGFLDLEARPGRYAVIGRHTSCDAVLGSDPEISLRQLLATSYVLEDGNVALRLLDLFGKCPMFLGDDVPRRSLVATGPLRLRLGRYVLAALPIVERALVTEGEPSVDDARVEVHEMAAPPRKTLGGGRDEGHPYRSPSSVASLPPVTGIQLVGVAVGPGRSRITVEREGRGASVEVTDADLDRGVLIGRADQCFDGGLRRVLSDVVSRAHLLLLRDGDKVFAFDTGSTNGTYQRGARVRRVELQDAGTELLLGGQGGVKLTFRRG